MNPYEPSVRNLDDTGRKSRWLRAILILNAILIAIPVALAVLAYAMLRIELAREIGSNPDGPIVYETEFVGMSGPAWPMLAYFLAPNAILFAWLVVRRTK
tara:strand:+ start:2413 stop:2712 length:300 start_codon:yes stop_codon:yes gene_type:complete